MESVPNSKPYPKELRERAVAMVLEWRRERNRTDGGLTEIGEMLGVHPESIRGWVNRHQTDAGERPGLTTDERARLKELVISDAHGGIKAAIETVLSGSSWQRCRTHFMANFAGRVPKASWPMVATLVRSVFEQPDRDAVWGRLGDVVSKLTETGFVDAANFLLDAADDILAFSAFPVEHWPKIRSNNPQERLNKEIRRRTDVVGIFPNRQAVIRLLGALLAEQSDEWALGHRYIGPESLKAPRLEGQSDYDPRPAMDAAQAVDSEGRRQVASARRG